MSELGAQRHRARERALEISYEATMKGRSMTSVLDDLAVRPDDYTVALIEATDAHRDEAEALIGEFAVDWPLERIAVVDRLIMTMAVGELLMEDAPPVAVVLDESVELAKIYSTEGSPSFVNGVLSSIAQAVRD